VLDVGCGPGALTGVLIDRCDHVAACDPSPPFVEACAARFPQADVRGGRAEAIPFGDDEFDAALAQLVLHFVSDPPTAAAEMARVVRPGGTVAACVWEAPDGMEMLHHFREAAAVVDPAAPLGQDRLRFGAAGEIVDLLVGAGLVDVVETTITVATTYSAFDELWAGFLAGIGPHGAYCAALPDATRAAVRDELFARLGRPAGAFSLRGTARCGRGRVPSNTVGE
jgi:SAM-dependent methyltransferase